MQNYFDIFDLQLSFDIDKVKLKQSFNQQIIKFHPDKFANSSENEKIAAITNTSLLNTAFNTLKTSLNRATYILELKNINVFDEKDTNMNSSFLLEMIDLQENLASIDSEFEIDEFIDNINNKVKNNILQLTVNFSENNLANVKSLVRELKFYTQTKLKAQAKINL